MANPGSCDRPSFFFFFQGLHLLRWASLLKEEAQQLEVDGLQKIELAVAGSETEGLYRLPEGSSITFLHVLCPTPLKGCHHTPTTTVSKPPPQQSEGVEPEPSAPAAEQSGLAQEAPSLAVSQALEVVIPAHMTPLCLNVGASKASINAGLRGAVRNHQPPGLPYAHMSALTI